MKIEKIEHSSVVVEEQEVKILFDPGIFSASTQSITDLNFIIITHKHSDHFDIDLLKKILAGNPEAKIITNTDVGAELDKEEIAYEIVDDGKTFDMNGVKLEAFGTKHAPIHPAVPDVENTSYLVAEKFFHPGDAYYIISKPIEVLALPLSAPWGTIGASIDYALATKPKKCFSIHDGMLKVRGPFDIMPKNILTPAGIEYLEPKAAQNIEI